MATKIESNKLPIKDVFNDKWFRIPEYQRPYVWTKDQIYDLLDDITSAYKSDKASQFFLGSLVLKKNADKLYDEYDLLDGQQRITTLFLIIAVIRDIVGVKNQTRHNTCKNIVYQQENPDCNIPERLRVVFDIREEVAEFIDKYVKCDGSTQCDDIKDFANKKECDISIKNMASAILNIRDFFESENNINEFFPFLLNNVLLIYVSSEDLDDAFRLFTILNNRGVKLRNADILKAENIGKIDLKNRSIYAKKWENIEKYFGEDFDVFLSHLRTILVKQKATTNLLREFEDNVYNVTPPLLQKGKDSIDFFENYKKYYEFIFEEEKKGESYEIYNRLSVMKYGFESDIWVAPLLRFYDKFKTEHLAEFVQKLDCKFASDWILAQTPTKRTVNINDIIDCIDKNNDSQTVINSNALDFNKEELLACFKSNIYGKRWAKYIMYKLEFLNLNNKDIAFALPKTTSIEHVLPQTPSKESQWNKDFDDESREFWTNKIGNLVLISRRKNSALGNLDYEKKVDKYFKTKTENLTNVLSLYKTYNTWTPTEVAQRNESILNLLKKDFNIK